MVAQHIEDNSSLGLSRLPSGRLQNPLRLPVVSSRLSLK
jgi:hypothetical protein